MYSDKKSVLQLASLLLAHGIRQVVVAPGSRNIPLTQTFMHMPGLVCHPVTDERSAGFFALGLALGTQSPVAVCCTSGSALLNLHPAVAEAYYQQVPLVVISADRPAAWIGQMDGQTLPQPGVFGKLVRYACTLTEAHTPEEEWFNNRLLNEALLALGHRVQGPVHINVPLSEPLFRFTVPELPAERVIRRSCLPLPPAGKEEVVQTLRRCPKRWILCGQMPPSLPALNTGFPASNAFLWVGEHLCNAILPTDTTLTNLDALLGMADETTRRQLAPDLVVTLGGHIVSKRIKQYLRSLPRLVHWHVCPDGQVVDLFGKLRQVFEASPEAFLATLSACIGKEEAVPAGYLDRALALSRGIPTPPPDSTSVGLTARLLERLNATAPRGTVLHLANSSAVRYAQLFPLRPDIVVQCNRGVNGIEGSLSAAVGHAVANPAVPNYLLIGDLSYYYDHNALWDIAQRTCNLRILLLNNHGGEIFHALPGLQTDQATLHCIGGHHTTQTGTWAEANHIGYMLADLAQGTPDERARKAEALIDRLTHPGTGVLVAEALLDMEEDIRQLQQYYRSLTQER